MKKEKLSKEMIENFGTLIPMKDASKIIYEDPMEESIKKILPDITDEQLYLLKELIEEYR